MEDDDSPIRSAVRSFADSASGACEQRDVSQLIMLVEQARHFMNSMADLIEQQHETIEQSKNLRAEDAREVADALAVAMRQLHDQLRQMDMARINEPKRVSDAERRAVLDLDANLRADFPKDYLRYEKIGSELGLAAHRVRYIVEGPRRTKSPEANFAQNKRPISKLGSMLFAHDVCTTRQRIL